MKQELKILICYNAPAAVYSVYTGKEEPEGHNGRDLSEAGFLREIEDIETILRSYFTEVLSYPVSRNITGAISDIRRIAPDIILNLVESVEGISSFEAYFTGVYDLLGLSYSGNTPQCLGNSLDKAAAKKILNANFIRTPDFQVIGVDETLSQQSFELKFPVITKLIREDASIGISEFSVVNSFEALEKQISFLRDTYKQDIIVEEYIEGREFNAAVLDGRMLPLSEIDYSSLPDELPRIVTYEGKWIEGSIYYLNTVPVCPAKVDTVTADAIEKAALKAYRALDCRDYARVDLRLTENGEIYIIEVNPNPDISADSGYLRAAAAAGLSRESLLKKLIELAYNRTYYDTEIKTG